MATAVLGLLMTWVTRRSDRFSPEHRPALHAFEDRLATIGDIEHSRHIAAELESAWRDFLRDRWEVPPGSSPNHWSRDLGERGASERTCNEIERLSEDIHYLRYAPQMSSNEALEAELVQRSRQILKSLH